MFSQISVKKKIILCVSALCFFITSAVQGTLAAWAAESETVNYLTMSSMTGEIVEEYTAVDNAMPGQQIDKVVNAKNTGDIDCVVRVRIEKLWGSERDKHGVLIPDSTLNPDMIHIIFNTKMWYEEDGYFYYKDVLTPNSITKEPLFNYFTLDKSMTKEYANKTADIRVYAEFLQADGNACGAVWGVSYEKLGITRPEQTVFKDTAVKFISPDKEFDIETSPVDLFANFKNLVPGTSRKQTITVTNEYEDAVEIFLRADSLVQDQATDATRDLIEQMLKKYAVITVRDESGKVLYNGPVWGNIVPDAENNATTMKYNISLGEFTAGETKALQVDLTLDSAMDNQFQTLLGKVQWIFSCSGEDTPITPPKTGSSNLSVILMWISLACFSVFCVVLIAGKVKKTPDRCEEEKR